MARIRKLDVSSLPKVQEGSPLACCLYVIQEEAGEHFKIGIAQHPHRRLSCLQGGNRRKLSLVAAYEGPRSVCLAIERSTLKFFGTINGLEWVYAEGLEQIERYIGSFVEEEPE